MKRFRDEDFGSAQGLVKALQMSQSYNWHHVSKSSP